MDKNNIIDKEKIKGVLFDFDGVIGKSMEDNFAALKKSFKEYDVDIKEIDLFAREGGTAKEIITEICIDYGVDPELWKAKILPFMVGCRNGWRPIENL